MKPPLTRMHARSETRHHLLFEKPDWTRTDSARRVRELGSFVVGVKRAPHDYLHQSIKPPQVPVKPVIDAMFEIGREYCGWQNDSDRLERILDGMVGFAKAVRSPEQADQMWSVSSNIAAQLAVVQFFNGARPRYE